MEKSVTFSESFESAIDWCKEAFGPEIGRLNTTFFVFHTGLAVISLYQTHLSNDVFFEIEVQDEKDIQAVEDQWKFLGLEREERSLFQIFFGDLKKAQACLEKLIKEVSK
jgi:hypothetical protein